ncbi:2TM domain-containing protein [Methanobrevibacter arboriphilus]|uniref:2TM domain-containing protein n=1 Tax=Methanobrevibacter arboriphilus TaxID=39441 RepID=UPI001CDACF23
MLKKRVKEVKIFYKSLISYIIINIFLFVINLIFSPGFWWFLFVVAIWGIFIVLQFLRIFVFKNKIFGEDWEDKKNKRIYG